MFHGEREIIGVSSLFSRDFSTKDSKSPKYLGSVLGRCDLLGVARPAVKTAGFV
jgi:hypothetical protein